MHATRSDLPRTLSWTAAGTDLLLLRLADFPDAELDGPSLLPDWTRRHVLAHLARNAEALGRLLSWAQTGVPTPMYADREQRQRDIDLSAANDAGQLRRELSETAEALRLHAAQLDEAQWAAGLLNSRGRELPAVEVPWMRAREVWLHALDLDVGVSVEELPGDFSEALIEDVLEYFANVPACPAMRIVSEASGREWTLGESRDATVVRGSAPELAAWLTGRSAGQGLRAERLPDLPPWL